MWRWTAAFWPSEREGARGRRGRRAPTHEHLLPLLTRMTFPLPGQRPAAAECAELLRTPAAPARPARPPVTVRHGVRERLLPPAPMRTQFTITLPLPGCSYVDGTDQEQFSGSSRRLSGTLSATRASSAPVSL